MVESASGGTLDWREDGRQDAPAILFCNSLATDLGMWDEMVVRVGDTARLLRWSYPGHGRSTPPSGEMSIDTLVRDALAVMDAADADEAHFCGISLGGMVAIHAAATAPDRVQTLLAAHTTAHVTTPQMWQDRIETVKRKGTAPLIEPSLDRWFTPGFANAARLAEMREMLSRVHPMGYVACARVLASLDLRDDLACITCPTLVVHARDDPAMTLQGHEAIAAGIAEARLEVVPGAHISSVEHPERFARLICGLAGI